MLHEYQKIIKQKVKYGKMRMIKKKLILPGLVFVIGMGILGTTVYSIRNREQEQSRITADLNAMTYAERMQAELAEGVGITGTLEQMLISESGKIEKFSQVAENMMTDAIQSIQIAPNGVVTEIYPEEGNEAGKIDLIHDSNRGQISRYARDHHIVVLQGPFQLKQGGDGIAVRKPVYLKDENGQSSFWGFAIVIIRVPEIFANSVKSLTDFGYEYRLSKTISPWTSVYKEVDSSGQEPLINPVSYTFEMGEDQWKLEIMPQSGWVNSRYSYEVLAGGLMIVVLLTGLTGALMILDEHRQRFKKLAVTDALTGIYNRHGFDEEVLQYLKQYPKKPCVIAPFDVDDFKCINDMYGHASGDLALQILSESMQKFFPKRTVLGRNGGDEFCIFLPDCTCEEISYGIEKFTKMERSFPYEGENHTFSISLGYAEYPTDAKTYAQLLHCADAALYEVKLRGKNGCLRYQKGLQFETRTQLGFALKDVSENLPGAFIIYKADKENDEILFANREMLELMGCETMEELFSCTKKSFRNLVREDEQERVEAEIWKQIEEGNFNDYVHFHLKRGNGTYIQVLDHGRIVENSRHGNVFYVLIVDWNMVRKHYKKDQLK